MDCELARKWVREAYHKPGQTIFSHGNLESFKIKLRNLENSLKTLQNPGNQKTLFKSCEKLESPQKTMRSCRNQKIRKKAAETRKEEYIPEESRKPMRRLGIVATITVSSLIKYASFSFISVG